MTEQKQKWRNEFRLSGLASANSKMDVYIAAKQSSAAELTHEHAMYVDAQTQLTERNTQYEKLADELAEKDRKIAELLGQISDFKAEWERITEGRKEQIAELEVDNARMREAANALIENSGKQYHVNGGDDFYQINHEYLAALGEAADNGDRKCLKIDAIDELYNRLVKEKKGMM